MKRFFKNRTFTLGAVVILLFTLPAIPGYLITPDKTSDANDMVSAIANRPPGFSCHFVREKSRSDEKNSWLGNWLHGKNDQGNAIPILAPWRIEGDTLFAKNTDGENVALVLSELKGGTTPVYKRTFYLGTDRLGRDVLSRLILGARVSLFVGLISVIISLLIGTCIGMLAGYAGGKTDAVLSWLIAVFWSIPTLLIALGLSFVFGKGLGQVLVAIGLSTWVEVARVVRGQAMQLREREFILAARISGFSTWRILFVHILPNLKGSLTVLATTNFASAILLEAGLSFLGLGISPPSPSWGVMVKEHLGNLVLDSAYLAIIPGAAIMLLVMGFNFLSMGLRDLLDTRLQTN